MEKIKNMTNINPPLPPKENWEEQSYFTKDSVYGDEPLMEIIYEIEDCFVADSNGKFASQKELLPIFARHKNTVKEALALLQKEKEEAYIHGIESVTSCRCRNHLKVPLLNTNEFGGAECGACVESQARSTALDDAIAAVEKEKKGYVVEASRSTCDAILTSLHALKEKHDTK